MSAKKFLIGSVILAGALVVLGVSYMLLGGVLPGSFSVKQSEPEFDPSALTWHEATTSSAVPWRARDSAASFVFQGKIWTMGGINGQAEVAGQGTVFYWEAPHFNDIWTTEDGEHWSLVKEHAEWAPRRSMSVVPFQGKLFMFGGWSPVSGYNKEIWESTDGATWMKSTSTVPWSPREGNTVEVFQGKMWILGGVNYDTRETSNEVWYSENGLDWSEATTTIPWSGRWDHATAVFNGKMYLAGGMDLAKHTFKDVWVSSDGFHWELITANPPWTTRQGHGLLVFHDRLWLVGRLNDIEGGGVNDVWYSADGITWEKTLIDPPWRGREDHAALVFKDHMYIFGGMDADWKWRNDIWISSN